MKACVAGATGAIGRLVVNGLAKDRRCVKVQVIVRAEKPAAFWFLSDAEFAKVEQVVAPDVAKLDASKITACTSDSAASGCTLPTASRSPTSERLRLAAIPWRRRR